MTTKKKEEKAKVFEVKFNHEGISLKEVIGLTDAEINDFIQELFKKAQKLAGRESIHPSHLMEAIYNEINNRADDEKFKVQIAFLAETVILEN